MWFNNALIYQFECSDLTNMHEHLAEERLKPCPPHARFIFGWAPVLNDLLVFESTNLALIALGKEERLLPRSVLQRVVMEQVLELETKRGYPVKRAEKAQMTEEIEFDLLPKAFCVQKKLYALLDNANQRLIINTTSRQQASQLIALLCKSIPGMNVTPLSTPDNPSLHFNQWIREPKLCPKTIELAADCLLVDPINEKKRFQCKGTDLSTDEMVLLLDKGMDVAEIAFTWHERIDLTLTQDFVLKRLRCRDEIEQFDDEYQQFEASILLLTQTFSDLITDLQKILTTK